MSALKYRSEPAAAANRQRQLGAASLAVVLMLFFVIALVSAYTSRNLIFEQRTSVNQYRSTMAFEAAEAGLAWATALLNGGRIGNNCTEATSAPASTSFSQRYLFVVDTSGFVKTRRQSANALLPLRPTCVWGGADWVCDCPVDGNPALVLPAGGGLLAGPRRETPAAPARSTPRP